MASEAGIVSGPEETFDRLTQTRLDRAYRVAGAILGNDTEAEDVVQESAIAAWRRWSDLRDPDRFDAWFDRILINRCRDRLRARKADRHLEDWSPAVGEFDANRRVDECLLQAIDMLSPDHKAVVVLRFVEDLDLSEIAIRTGSRVGTVKSRLHYAMRELRAAYDAAQRVGGGRR